MRAEVEFSGVAQTVPKEWIARLRNAINANTHPAMLAAAGVTASLLAYCGVTLRDLVMREVSSSPGVVAISLEDVSRYSLVHLIDALRLTFSDLLLLGFTLPLLAEPKLFPLIALYDLCQFRADTLFRFDMSYADLKRFVLDVDSNYAPLLDLNLSWWRAALAPPPPSSVKSQ